MGKGATMAKKQAKERKNEMVKAQMQKNVEKVRHK